MGESSRFPERLTQPRLLEQFQLGNITASLYEPVTDEGRQPYIELTHTVPNTGKKQTFVCRMDRFEELYTHAKGIVEERSRNVQQERAVPLGRITVEKEAEQVVNHDDLKQGLESHAQGHWGQIDASKQQHNEQSLLRGGSVVSVHRDRNGAVYSVETNSERTATRVSLGKDLEMDIG